MATLLYKRQRAQLGALELDVSITESHEGPVDVTEFPVEEGFDISDHARPKAESVTIEAFISNTPIPFNAEGASVESASYPYAAGVVEWESKSKALMTASDDSPPAAVAYDLLRKMREEAQMFTLVTGLRTYEDMVITNLTVPRSATVGNGLQFTIIAKQVRVVQAQVNRIVTVAEDKAKPKQKLEKKATDTGPRKSVADEIFDAATSFFK